MAKHAKQDNIVEKRESTVPVEPSVNQFNLYGITPPSDFALYGTDSKSIYDAEVQRVTNQLRQEVFYNIESEQIQSLTDEDAHKKVKRVNGAAILIFIASALILALYIVGNYITIPTSTSLLFVADNSGLGVIFDLINVFLKGSDIIALTIIMQISVAVVALVSFVAMISSLCIMTRPGIGKAIKFLLFLNFIVVVMVAIMLLINKQVLPIGYYILFGLVFISMVFGIFARGKKEKGKKISRRKNG